MWPLAVGLPSLGCGSRGESLVSVLSVSLLSAFFFFLISVVGCSSVRAVPSRLLRRFVLCVELMVFFNRAQVLLPVCLTFPSIP